MPKPKPSAPAPPSASSPALGGGRSSQADVAELAGVSQSVVSAVIRADPSRNRFSEAARERVLEAARTLNYRPSHAARSMRAQRFFNLGLFVSGMQTVPYVPGSLYSGISRTTQELHYHLTFVNYRSETEGEPKTLPRSLREAHVDGLLVYNSGFVPRAARRSLQRMPTPWVRLNGKHRENSVNIDDLAVGRTMTEHLLAAGFDAVALCQIGHAGPVFGDYSNDDRAWGYREAMRAAGRPERVLTLDPVDVEGELHRLLAAPDRPRCLFCHNDELAMVVQRVCYAQRLRVPGDVAVAGVNDDIVASLSPVPLTTMRLPWQQLGIEGVQMLIRLLDDPGTPQPAVTLQAQLTVRDSARAG